MFKNSVMVAGLVACFGSAAFSDVQNATATVVMTDGTRYEVLEFDRGEHQDCIPMLNYDKMQVVRPDGDVSVEIPVSLVTRIEINSYDGKNKNDDDRIEGQLILSNGNSLPLGRDNGMTRLGVDHNSSCSITILDDFTGVEQDIRLDFYRGEDGPNVAMVDFEGIGGVKWSTTSNRIFPDSYSFDPFTGSQLVPFSPSD